MPGSLRVCLTTPELNALYGLPHICWVLYLAIRSAMDRRSRIAGELYGVSWWIFQEACFVEPHSGIQRTGTPSLEQVRAAARHLQRAGLVLFMSDGNAHELKFKCSLAPTLSLVQNKPNRPFSEQPNRPLRPENDPQPNRPNYDEPNKHLGSTLSIKSIGTSNRVARARTAPDEVEKRSRSGELLNNGFLTPTQLRQCKELLQRAGLTVQVSQMLIDELYGWIRQGKSTDHPVRNPVGYLKSIIKSSREPGWKPRYATEVAHERADLARRAPDDPTRAAGPARPAKVSWEGLPSNIARRIR